jgi:hypothetical protein
MKFQTCVIAAFCLSVMATAETEIDHKQPSQTNVRYRDTFFLKQFEKYSDFAKSRLHYDSTGAIEFAEMFEKIGPNAWNYFVEEFDYAIRPRAEGGLGFKSERAKLFALKYCDRTKDNYFSRNAFSALVGNGVPAEKAYEAASRFSTRSRGYDDQFPNIVSRIVLAFKKRSLPLDSDTLSGLAAFVYLNGGNRSNNNTAAQNLEEALDFAHTPTDSGGAGLTNSKSIVQTALQNLLGNTADPSAFYEWKTADVNSNEAKVAEAAQNKLDAERKTRQEAHDFIWLFAKGTAKMLGDSISTHFERKIDPSASLYRRASDYLDLRAVRNMGDDVNSALDEVSKNSRP